MRIAFLRGFLVFQAVQTGLLTMTAILAVQLPPVGGADPGSSTTVAGLVGFAATLSAVALLMAQRELRIAQGADGG